MSIKDLLGDIGKAYDRRYTDWAWTPVLKRKITLSMHRDPDFPPHVFLFEEIAYPKERKEFSHVGMVCYEDKQQCYMALSYDIIVKSFANVWKNIEWEEIDEWEGTNKEYLQLLNSKRPKDNLLTFNDPKPVIRNRT